MAEPSRKKPVPPLTRERLKWWEMLLLVLVAVAAAGVAGIMDFMLAAQA